MSRFAAVAASALVLAALPIGAPAQAATGQVSFAVDAPHVQYTYVPGAVVETFNTDCDSPLEVGAFTGYCGYGGGNFYAGADATTPEPATGGFSSNFLTVASGQSLTITLDQPAYYLGFHWEAGNEYDRVQLFNDGELVANFSFESLMTALNESSFVADSGDTYLTDDYYGNPVTGQQGHEPYAFVHIFATGGVVFDQVVISEDAGSPGAFEIDNLAVAYTQQEIDTEVYTFDVVDVDLGDSGSNALAETGFDVTSLVAFAGLAAVAGFVAIRRRARS